MNLNMEPLSFFIKRRPRTAAAIAFGCTTAVVTYFTWIPQARMSGYVLLLTIAVGLCHALAGLVTGSRLVDRVRTQTPVRACLLGAGTSLLATILLAPPLTWWVSATSTRPGSVLSHLLLAFWIGLFSFLAVGWTLLLVSVGIGWALYRMTAPRAANLANRSR